MASKVEITGTMVIKPSSTTPNHLKSFRLSLLDQIAPSPYIPVVFFYHQPPTNKPKSTIAVDLKASLSQVLTRYYPFAGRINETDHSVINCNDDGVPYFEAFVSHPLSEILKNPKPKTMDQLVPLTEKEKSERWPAAEDGTVIPLLIQVSFFECGGMAIGICASHMISDAATLFVFIKEWANTYYGNQPVLLPDFTISTRYPPVDSWTRAKHLPNLAYPPLALKRFVFDASSISALKAKVHPSTRVQAVSALLWKCAMKTSKSKITSSIMTQAVNMRRMVHPPLPENSFGNFVGSFLAQKNYEEEDEMELDGLVDKMKLGFNEFHDGYMKQVRDGTEAVASDVILTSFKETRAMLKKEGTEVYYFSSWCRFGYYETDFGWGKPVWVSTTILPVKNDIVLMDSKEGNGIEAWVTLEEEHMGLFEKEQELLGFSCVDPGISMD